MNIKDRVKVLGAPAFYRHTIGMKGVVTSKDHCGVATIMLDCGEECIYRTSHLEVVYEL